MYTCMWVPTGLLFLFSLWGFIANLRAFVFELRNTLFPAKHLFWIAVCLAGMVIGFAGMVWLVDLMMYRNANPVPIEVEPPCC